MRQNTNTIFGLDTIFVDVDRTIKKIEWNIVRAMKLHQDMNSTMAKQKLLSLWSKPIKYSYKINNE